MTTEKDYYELAKQGKTKKYILSIQNFRDTLYDYQPGQIWLDDFSEDYPYIEGKYADRMFYGAYVHQSLLTFSLDSLSELESVFKEGMYIYV